ncbi:MnhB domain-containing protein [Salinispira pacifica]|uniref:Putative Na(+) H(+) antiporter subunit B n=1 Tax=Salinispira pacifica TaxID=1307761 RepID=V5WHR6_9SPIO|nr:MnhB domain-containing protein [Salinispira pacifica]AHC15372.1 putative Na(+) H(+) antiporter subunit B [Salinispira pacifica]
MNKSEDKSRRNGSSRGADIARSSGASAAGFYIQIALAVLAAGLLILPLILSEHPWPEIARDFLENNARQETGALNTVSSIYLGYRVFDTLGETIVLLVAVSGTIGIIAHSGSVLAKGFDLEEPGPSTTTHGENIHPKRLRTALIEVVTGKLGPIVLIFGVYVMLYGHLSPGGGFQGGVVIASGIVFLSLGGRRGASTRLTEPGILAGLEAGAFCVLILAGLTGSAVAQGFFSNFISGMGLPDVAFIVFLNTVIGLKVGAGIGFMSIAMLGRVHD